MDKRFEVDGVDASTPLVDAAPRVLSVKAAPLFELEAAARGGADADAVHDMRVASRRLREAMRLFQPLWDSSAFQRWYRRVRRVTRSLGPVRDSDVFLEELAQLAPKVVEKFPNSVFFGGQLVFPDDTFAARWLHNYTIFAVQKSFYRAGYPFVLLPIRV